MPLVRPRTLPFLVGLPLLLASCGDSTGPGTSPEPRLRITPGDVSLVAEWHTVQLRAEIVEADGDTVPVEGAITWSSSAPELLPVDAAGVVRRTGLGTATITATSDGLSGSVAVTAEALTALTSGMEHACGLTEEGKAYCWGQNGYGALGNGIGDSPSETPVAVVGGLHFREIRTGGYHTCGITVEGETYCWGYNVSGQLGLGSNDNEHHPTPARVASEIGFESLVTGGGHFTCGLNAAGAAYCWGWDNGGRLGDGRASDDCALGEFPNPCRTTPSPVYGGLVLAAVSAGNSHACGLTPTGEAFCWGSNGAGQLGHDGASTDAPVAIAGRTFRSLHAGGALTCGIEIGGALYCTDRDEGAEEERSVHSGAAGPRSGLSAPYGASWEAERRRALEAR